MRRQLKYFDFTLLICACVLAVFGIVLISSATLVSTNGELSGEALKQIVWLIIGLVLLFAAAFINYRFICKFYIVIYLFCVFLLVITLVYGELTDADVRRWIYFGKVGIQPSEFAKLFMIIFLATYIEKNQDSLDELPVFGVMLAAIAVPVVLVMIQPSLSASLSLFFVSFIIIFVGNVSFKYIMIVAGAMIPAALLLGQGYQLTRIMTLFNPEANSDAYYQVNQSLQAIGSGQMSGKGLHNGMIVQSGSLPAPHTDFVFSVLGEEFGFIGCVLVLAIMLYIIVKTIIIAQTAADMSGRLIASGVAGLLAFQTFVNVGVTTGILPNTGMPLPFISYGGSSMWVCMMAIGLVINVGMTKTKSIFEE